MNNHNTTPLPSADAETDLALLGAEDAAADEDLISLAVSVDPLAEMGDAAQANEDDEDDGEENEDDQDHGDNEIRTHGEDNEEEDSDRGEEGRLSLAQVREMLLMRGYRPKLDGDGASRPPLLLSLIHI